MVDRLLASVVPGGMAAVLALVLVAGTSPAQLAPSASVVGTKSSKIYHSFTCGSARRLTPTNRVVFPSLAVAEANGFRACRSCKPNSAISMASATTAPRPAAPAPTPAAPIRPRAAQEKPTFTTDVAPVLVANCLRCHNAEERKGEFDMSSFRKLMAGSAAGAVIEPGKPAESELLLRIKGESQPKMPPGNTDLADETIATIQAWVEAGALLDAGVDANASLADVAVRPEDLRRAELAAMSPEQREALVAETGKKRWQMAVPEGEPATTAGEHFIVFGDLPAGRVEALLETLEKARASVAGLLNRPGKPALDGPMPVSLYVFTDLDHYAEFVRTVARQEPDLEERARGDLRAEVPYLAAMDPLGGNDGEPAEGTRGLDALLVEQLASGAVVQAEAAAPRWLALGVGAFMAAQLEPRGTFVNDLRGRAVRAYQLGWTTKASEALGDQLDADETRALGFSLLEWLTTSNRRTVAPFVRGMLDGKDKLDEGVQYLFGANRDQFLQAWGRWVASKYGSRR